MRNTWTQGENEKRLYQQSVTGDTVNSATWTLEAVDPDTSPSPTVGLPSNSSGTTTVMISGLKAGTTYKGIVHIVGASGQEYESAFEIISK